MPQDRSGENGAHIVDYMLDKRKAFVLCLIDSFGTL